MTLTLFSLHTKTTSFSWTPVHFLKRRLTVSPKLIWKTLTFLSFFFIDTYEPDGYNPEAPSITSAGRSQYRQFFTRAQTQRPNLIGLTSGEMDTNPRGRKGFYFSLRTSVFIFPFSRLKAMFFLTDLVFQSSFQTSEILWHLYFFFLFFFLMFNDNLKVKPVLLIKNNHLFGNVRRVGFFCLFF